MSRQRRLESKITRKYLEKSFNFATSFHLSPKKPKTNRTTGQVRGLGGVADSFLLGKSTELAVVDIMKKIHKNKSCVLDFEVHDRTDKDPDIIGVIKNRKQIKPGIFVEIKNIGEGDRWIGLTEEQFATIQKNTVVGKNLKKIYIVYAVLKNKKEVSEKKNDLLGSYLKIKTKSKKFAEFSNVKDFFVEVKAVLTAHELKKKGKKFEKGYYFYETEIFPKAKLTTLNHRCVKQVKVKSNILPEFKIHKPQKGKKFPPFPKRFAPIRYKGKIRLYKKNNEKTTKMYVYCSSNVKVSCKILGDFFLKKGRLYEYNPTTVGRNPQLNRNNVWIPVRNMKKIIGSSPRKMLSEIVQKI